jgi:hypothetical protein
MNTTYQCPLCNGFQSYTKRCPHCQQTMIDYGPISYLFSDYSPYHPIENSKQTDSWLDLERHICPNEVYCPTCGYEQVEFIKELEKETT